MAAAHNFPTIKMLFEDCVNKMPNNKHPNNGLLHSLRQNISFFLFTVSGVTAKIEDIKNTYVFQMMHQARNVLNILGRNI